MTSELYEKINEIKDQISQIEKEQRLINPNNYFETDIKIKKIRTILSSIEKDIEEASIIYEGLQKQEQLEVISEIKLIENEYKIKKNNVDKIEEKNTQKLNWEKLRNNEISGYDAEKIERKEYENQYHEVENHEEIINTIHKDVKETNHKQGETIDNVRYIVQITDDKMTKANKITNSMICSAKCMKCSLCFLIILLLILNVLLGTYIIFRKFVWNNK